MELGSAEVFTAFFELELVSRVRQLHEKIMCVHFDVYFEALHLEPWGVVKSGESYC